MLVSHILFTVIKGVVDFSALLVFLDLIKLKAGLEAVSQMLIVFLDTANILRQDNLVNFSCVFSSIEHVNLENVVLRVILLVEEFFASQAPALGNPAKLTFI